MSIKVAGTVVITDNKGLVNRSVAITTASTITPTGDTADTYSVTALATAATIATPSGTPADGQKLILRIEDNGTPRALTWTTSSGAYRGVGVTLPTTTEAGKGTIVGCIYNASDVFWDVVAVSTGISASDIGAGNLSYSGALTGGTGIVNIGSGQIYKNASGFVGIGTSNPLGTLHQFSTLAQTERILENGSIILLERASTTLGSVTYGTTTNHPLVFTTNNAEQMRIDSSGIVCVGTTGAQISGAEKFTVRGMTSLLGLSGAASVNVATTGTGTQTYINFGVSSGGASTGTISTNGTTTAYNTTSDYRLKENIAPMTGALDTVAKLKPVTYKWKSDGSDSQGFIAHELQAVVPDCVTGEKDAVDAEGKPVYQGIDTSFLVASLTAAIQELNAKVDAQTLELNNVKAELQTLKNV